MEILNSVEVNPNISNFVLSLRDIGYSFDSAVADIIDNSISANAKCVNIYANASNASLAIIDNGNGLTKTELLEAMRLGTASPNANREEHDLGRFGLGLKTASFSQCKRLTVLSKKSDGINAFCWDLDYITKENKWSLQEIDPQNYINEFWYKNFMTQQEGTVVIWEKIDRYEEDELNTKFDDLIDHLALTFHRFLEGEFSNRHLKIYFNQRLIEPFNPFNEKCCATQRKSTEIFRLNNENIYITPYILPHHSKVSKKDYEKYATKDGYQKSQGFYLYREGRLLIHGTWFGLHKQSDAHKLVRIKIDINNSLDFLWKIDVKKSTAMPTPAIKNELRRILKEITVQGFKVYSQRGNKVIDKSMVRYWDLVMKDGMIKYKVNREHPLYKSLENNLTEKEMSLLNSYLNDIENYLPIESIVAKHMEVPHDIKQKNYDFDKDKVISLLKDFKNNGFDNEFIISILEKSEGFKTEMDNIKLILENIDE